ncbi:hypothetical protein FRB91_005728 [Serendipita sp. 411]|nr:hypothetical protein FRB91_005728 [Serendipita sp. 411]
MEEKWGGLMNESWRHLPVLYLSSLLCSQRWTTCFRPVTAAKDVAKGTLLPSRKRRKASLDVLSIRFGVWVEALGATALCLVDDWWLQAASVPCPVISGVAGLVLGSYIVF